MKKRAQLPWIIEDDTLKTPEHDAMVIHLLNTSNVKLLIPRLAEFLDEAGAVVRLEEYHRLYFEGRTLGDLINDGIWQCLHSHTYPTFIKTEVCLTVMEERRAEEARKNWAQAQEDFDAVREGELEPRKLKISSEVPIYNGKQFIIGYWDICIMPINPESRGNYFTKLWRGNTPHPYFIEVKPTIRSFGETLRQIQTYKAYTHGHICLFTNDARFKNEFETQDITVLLGNSLLKK